MSGDLARFTDLVDRHGHDFELWPVRKDALWARQVLLAQPEARAAHDDARRLAEALSSYGAALDAMIAPDAASRVAAAVMARLPKRVSEVRWWMPRIAAGFMLAVMAGGMFDIYLDAGQAADTFEMAALDAFVYGPGEIDLP